jgi:hypothetical protein
MGATLLPRAAALKGSRHESHPLARSFVNRPRLGCYRGATAEVRCPAEIPEPQHTLTSDNVRSGEVLALPMRAHLLVFLGLIVIVAWQLQAQDLAPRAYLITPLHSNAVTLTWSFYTGGLDLNGTVPVNGATGTYNVGIFTYYHSLDFFGRSANVTASLPYAAGSFSGDVLGNERSIYRSGLVDFSARFAVNLLGGPAMEPHEFAQWRQKTILGVSLKVIAPTGQYDPNRLVNWGINRWAFKPEIGYSRRLGKWVLDGYGGVWLYTKNDAFYSRPVPLPQTQEPIGSFEGHLSYDLPRFRKFATLRPWTSLDGNFWFGGVTSLNGIANLETRQTSSRLGGTLALPFTSRQSLKLAYSHGTFTRFGGDYHNLQVAWQYSWNGWPR